VSIFNHRPARAQLLEQLAKDLVKPVVKEPPPTWLTEHAEQAPENVRAEWVALQRWVLDYTIQKTLVSYEKVQPLWETVESNLRANLAAQPFLPHFQKIANERAKEYGDWFNYGLAKCRSAQPLFTFFGYVATRILKPYQPLKVGLAAFEQEIEGADMVKRAAVVAALSHHITANLTSTAEFLKTLEAKVPQIFDGR
jgi:hypothetical protein